MSDNFNGSIAQVNVQFPIETVIQPLAGEAYSRALVYIPASQAENYLPGVSGAAAGQLVELNSNNYGELTAGTLKNSLVPFFTKATTAKLGVAIYDDGEEATTNKLADVYAATRMWAYFKFGITEAEGYNALQVSLSNLCIADPLYSDLWIGTSDTNVLNQTSALMTSLKAAGSNARVIYNSNAGINAALAQLGSSLSVVNTTGTPVGNNVDMAGFNTIEASGAADENGKHQNLSATEKTALDAQKIGYNTYVGDGTENVVTEGSLTLKGESVGANWVKHYIEFVCKTKAANLITRMNKFRNNATYQAILSLVTDTAMPFVAFGRLADLHLTAPVFTDLPASGDAITVPNAWEATYIDNVRSTTVYGTLYLTQPTR